MNNSVISIDLAKNVFWVCEFNQYYKPTSNKKVRRAKLLDSVRKPQADSHRDGSLL